MKTTLRCVLFGLLGLLVTGCGQPSGDGEDGSGSEGQDQSTASATKTGTAQTGTPAATVEAFLTAVRDGEDEQASSLLTDLARQKTGEMDLQVAPPGSDTAQFEIGEVEMLGEEGARVHCRWSDLDAEGNRSSEKIIWAVRREAKGWRIAGMAPTIFPGEPPLLLNFEDPEEMMRKLEWVREEVVRRAQAEQMSQARRAEDAASGTTVQ